MFPPSSVGGAKYLPHTVKIIRLIRQGCTNRPFYHISVMEKIKEPDEPVIEQIGSFDPFPNKENEKLVAVNFNRLEHWLLQGAEMTVPVRKLLGLAGYLPIHPDSFKDVWDNKKKMLERINKLKNAIAEFKKEKGSSSDSSSPEK